jgi:hypothetical protein
MKPALCFEGLRFLCDVLDQHSPCVTHDTLFGTYRHLSEGLTGQGWLKPASPLQHYLPPGADEACRVLTRNGQNVYLADYGSFVAVPPNALNRYQPDREPFVAWFREQLGIAKASRLLSYANDLLHYLGDCFLDRRKVSIFLVRRSTDYHVLEACEAAFLQSPTKHTKLVLSTSAAMPATRLRCKSPVISVRDVIDHSPLEGTLNHDYLAHVVFGGLPDKPRPFVDCSDDGGILIIGEKSWDIIGDKARQIIKAMVNRWQQNQPKNRWKSIIQDAGLEDPVSPPKNFFNATFKKEVIGYDKGFVWFLTD